ncbi:hypothetical protein NIES2101_43240 [Calothrix sp. HK-06]|nr:hypothetical protein NIES2101_43240 [Calothrix sp. HK-06]
MNGINLIILLVGWVSLPVYNKSGVADLMYEDYFALRSNPCRDAINRVSTFEFIPWFSNAIKVMPTRPTSYYTKAGKDARSTREAEKYYLHESVSEIIVLTYFRQSSTGENILSD